MRVAAQPQTSPQRDPSPRSGPRASPFPAIVLPVIERAVKDALVEVLGGAARGGGIPRAAAERPRDPEVPLFLQSRLVGRRFSAPATVGPPIARPPKLGVSGGDDMLSMWRAAEAALRAVPPPPSPTAAVAAELRAAATAAAACVPASPTRSASKKASSLPSRRSSRDHSSSTAFEDRNSDQSLALFSMLVKLFGVQRGVTPVLEGEAEDTPFRKSFKLFVLAPTSTASIVWQLLVSVVVLVSCLEVPFVLVFVEEPPPSMVAIGALFDAIMILDIFVSFNTAFVREDALVVGRLEIAKEYARGWLTLDLVSSVPIDRIVLALDQGSDRWHLSALKGLRVAKLVRLLRLLRLPRLFRFMTQWVEGDLASSFRMAKLVIVIVLFVHWNACLQYLVPAIEEFPPDSWVHQVPEGHPSVVAPAMEIGLQYTHSAFRAVSQMLCIGYGLAEPVRASEIWVVVWSMTIGASLYGLLVANMGHLLANVDHGSRRFANSFESLNTMMRARSLPGELRERVRAFMRQQYPSRKLYEPRTLLSLLPFQLQRDISRSSTRALVDSCPLLQGADPGFLSAISLVLTPQVVLPNEAIAREGERFARLVFIETGLVEIISGAEGRHITELGPGAYVGEVSCLELTGPAMTASATVVAATRCKVHHVEKADLDELLRLYPKMAHALLTIANRRIERYPSILLSAASQQQRGCEMWESMEQLSSAAVEGYLRSLEQSASRDAPPPELTASFVQCASAAVEEAPAGPTGQWSMRRRMSHGGSSPQKPAALRSESFRHSIDLQKDRALDVNDACVQRQAKVFERMHRESEEERRTERREWRRNTRRGSVAIAPAGEGQGAAPPVPATLAQLGSTDDRRSSEAVLRLSNLAGGQVDRLSKISTSTSG